MMRCRKKPRHGLYNPRDEPKAVNNINIIKYAQI